MLNHPKRFSRAYIHLPHTDGERIADAVASRMGSWGFIIIQSCVVLAWTLANLTGIVHFDLYPFILLNLLFSTQAAYAAPIIMMSQNRQAQKDHLRDDHEASEVDEMYQINEQQLQILQQQDTVLDQQTELLKLLRKLVPDADDAATPAVSEPVLVPVGPPPAKPQIVPPAKPAPVLRQRRGARK